VQLRRVLLLRDRVRLRLLHLHRLLRRVLRLHMRQLLRVLRRHRCLRVLSLVLQLPRLLRGLRRVSRETERAPLGLCRLLGLCLSLLRLLLHLLLVKVLHALCLRLRLRLLLQLLLLLLLRLHLRRLLLSEQLLLLHVPMLLHLPLLQCCILHARHVRHAVVQRRRSRRRGRSCTLRQGP